MFVESETKPAKIEIQGVNTDIANRKITVRYVFNLDIKENGNTYSYYQFLSEITIDLVFQSEVANILKYLYDTIGTDLAERVKILRTDIPQKIDW